MTALNPQALRALADMVLDPETIPDGLDAKRLARVVLDLLSTPPVAPDEAALLAAVEQAEALRPILSDDAVATILAAGVRSLFDRVARAEQERDEHRRIAGIAHVTEVMRSRPNAVDRAYEAYDDLRNELRAQVRAQAADNAKLRADLAALTAENAETRSECVRHRRVAEAAADYEDNQNPKSDDPDLHTLSGVVEAWRVENERLLNLKRAVSNGKKGA